MTMRYTAFVALTLAAFAASPANAQNLPKIIPTHFHTSYIPDGFDSNDQSQLVAEGTFINSCYKPARPKIKVDHAKKQIRIIPQAYMYDGICLEMLVDYHQVIDLGLLNAANYQVVQGNENEEFGQMKIRATTTSAPDDFLYAPISQAYLQSRGGENRLTLSGEFQNSCMRLVDVIVNVQKNVITVQPISELEQNSSCERGKFPFAKTLPLPRANAGRYLLHVRSLNAKAINNLVDLQ